MDTPKNSESKDEAEAPVNPPDPTDEVPREIVEPELLKKSWNPLDKKDE